MGESNEEAEYLKMKKNLGAGLHTDGRRGVAWTLSWKQPPDDKISCNRAAFETDTYFPNCWCQNCQNKKDGWFA